MHFNPSIKCFSSNYFFYYGDRNWTSVVDVDLHILEISTKQSTFSHISCLITGVHTRNTSSPSVAGCDYFGFIVDSEKSNSSECWTVISQCTPASSIYSTDSHYFHIYWWYLRIQWTVVGLLCYEDLNVYCWSYCLWCY